MKTTVNLDGKAIGNNMANWNVTGGNYFTNAAPTIQWQNTSSGSSYASANAVLNT